MPGDDFVPLEALPPTPLDLIGQEFAELLRNPCGLAVNGRKVGHGLPPRIITLGELVRLLPLCDQDARDAVWRELIHQARVHSGVWVMAALGLALPGLRLAAAMLARCYHDDSDDLDSALVAEFIEALRTVDPAEPLVLGRIRKAAYNQVKRLRYEMVSYAVRHIDLDEAPEPAEPAKPWGHPDFVLAEAVVDGVLDEVDAELIGATRLEGRPLTQVAKKLGISYPTAWRRRDAAEARLVAWLLSEKNLGDRE